MYYKTIFFFYIPTMLLLEKTSFDMILRNYGIIPGKDFLLDVLKRKTPSDVCDLTL